LRAKIARAEHKSKTGGGLSAQAVEKPASLGFFGNIREKN
jgi:hypothetical protein